MQGSFGRVFLGKWRETTVAIKLLSQPLVPPSTGNNWDFGDGSGSFTMVDCDRHKRYPLRPSFLLFHAQGAQQQYYHVMGLFGLGLYQRIRGSTHTIHVHTAAEWCCCHTCSQAGKLTSAKLLCSTSHTSILTSPGHLWTYDDEFFASVVESEWMQECKGSEPAGGAAKGGSVDGGAASPQHCHVSGRLLLSAVHGH